ncbi:MAG: hypothetical protein R3C56_40125 [Pirellulaceae bacterium]
MKAVPQIVWDLAWRGFLKSMVRRCRKAYFDKSTNGHALTAQEVVGAISLIRLMKVDTYHIARNGGAQQWVQGKFEAHALQASCKYGGVIEQSFTNAFHGLKSSGKDLPQ